MESLLFCAIQHGRVKTMRTMLSRGVYLNARNSEGNTLLMAAVLTQNTEIIRCLIDAGCDINLKNYDCKTALNLAFDYQKPTKKNIVLKMLFKADADPQAALHAAAVDGNADLIRLLVSKGVNLNAVDRKYDDWTLVHYAARHAASEDSTIFEVLFSSGADPNAQTTDGKTALHVLVENKTLVSLFEIVRVFAKYNADFNMTDRFGQTPLGNAVFDSHAGAVKALLIHGRLDVNEKSTFREETKLHRACANVDLATVKILLKNGADINALDYMYKSPLHVAIEAVNRRFDEYPIMEGVELIQYLLQRNPDVNTITSSGKNILNSCFYKNWDLSCDYLCRTLIEHLAKLRARGKPIRLSLLETMNEKPEHKSYFDDCGRELWFAKNSKIHGDCWVSFANILMDDERKLVQYAGNLEFSKYFTQKNHVCRRFPIYGRLIHARFLKAAKRRLVWDKAALTLCPLLPIDIEPQHSIIEKIFSYLSFQDLKKMCDE